MKLRRMTKDEEKDFCTSSSRGIGRSGQNLAVNAGSGTWIDGKRFGAGASEDEIGSWIEGLQ